ncbi:QueT transporter family protein [Carboxydochorda subterranea]|uniref:QueT transporter family protein n=1 Tax=Carboxydichorda subterranea TaxID=3109565 RepID=A0ABZ1BWX2_9FIRM|nr:QueT transporter family protein [Limnochorda sp. L945t]WRP17088.1 QueT transporter family protein [Limnochorda sp. L945t]
MPPPSRPPLRAGPVSAGRLARAGVIAAAYVAAAAALGPLSFGVPLGPVLVQFRAAEALSVLPILYPEAIPGLFVGVWLANVLGGLGPWDVWGGSLVSLLAACATWLDRRSWRAYVWPVAANGVLISLYLSAIFGLPYWSTALGITLSEALVVGALGVPLVRVLRRFSPRPSRPEEAPRSPGATGA